MVISLTAPVCLFVYKRLNTLKDTVASLQENDLAIATDLHIFSDSAGSVKDIDKVRKVRKYIGGIQGFKSVTIYISEKNNGLAKSIIEGVTKIINRYGKVIVLEDDLSVSINFLQFMNNALEAYALNEKIFTISGFSLPIISPLGNDVYFTKRSSSWGWATWQNRWQNIDWHVSGFKEFIRNGEQQKEFNQMGSDLTHMLKKQMNGVIDSWAIRWVYHQFKNDLFTVFPVFSKVINNGFSADSTNTYKINEVRFATVLDETGKKHFIFPQQPLMDKNIIKQYAHPFSIKIRALYKIKSLLHF